MTADFIGIVKIKSTKNVSATEKQHYYIANLRPDQIFKGKMPARIRVAGTKFESNSGSCEISVKAGEQWLIYLQRDSKGNYYLSHCSHPEKIQNNKGEDVSIFDGASFDLQQLHFLKKHVPDLHSDQRISLNYYKLSSFLNKYNDQPFKQLYAYFLIKFDEKLNVRDIQVISGLNDAVDQEIMCYLKNKAHWYTGRFRPNPTGSSTINKATTYVFGIYYNDHRKSLNPF